MSLNPEIAALVAGRPPAPKIEEADLPAFRATINAMTASAPRYEVPLAAIDDRDIATDAGALRVRVYTPVGKAQHPLIVFYHGGGFTIGDLNISDAICRALCAGTNAVLMSVDYRLAPEHPFPAGNDDCYAALCWAAKHAAELGADATRLAVAGDSAGANLSAAMTLRARDRGGPKIIAQLLMYPATRYPDPNKGSYVTFADGPMITTDAAMFFWAQYLPDAAARTNPDACPINAKTLKGLPPAFVGLGECDPTRDGGNEYADALAAAGVDTVKRIYPGMPHGFYSMIQQSRAAAGAMKDACAWLAQRLAKAG